MADNLAVRLGNKGEGEIAREAERIDKLGLIPLVKGGPHHRMNGGGIAVTLLPDMPLHGVRGLRASSSSRPPMATKQTPAARSIR